MKIFRQPWLALFLVFCLPAQALAAVLIECEQHVNESAYAESGSHETTPPDQSAHVAPDCHGSSNERNSAQSGKSTVTDLSVNSVSTTDANSCFHCSGACQNLKPLNLISKTQQVLDFENSAFSQLNQATNTGIRNNPARPPCQSILS